MEFPALLVTRESAPSSDEASGGVSCQLSPGEQGSGRNVLRRGFTLIEIVVVITLIALMTTLMVPEIRQSGNDSALRAGARNVISLFRLARSESITSQSKHRVCFHAGRNAVWIEVEREASDGVTRSYQPFTGIDYGSSIEGRAPVEGASSSDRVRLPDNALQLDDRVRFQVRPLIPEPFDTSEPPPPPVVRSDEDPEVAGVFMVYFRPDGTSDDREIVLQDATGFEMALLVDSVTSSVSIETRGRQVSR